MTDTMEESEVAHDVLTKADRCDVGGCPAQAFVLVKFLTGELMFCGHHYNKYEASLAKDAFDVIDTRDEINSKPESSA